MKKQVLALCAFLSLSASTTQAAPFYPPSPGTAPPQLQPSDMAYAAAMAEEGVEKLIGFIRHMRAQGNRLDSASAMAFLDREITPYFDFANMARWAAGATYRQLNARQRVRLQNKLKTMFYTTLANNLGSYRNQRTRFFPPRPSANGNELIVSVWLEQPPAYPIKLDFRFYHSAQEWKVYDVVANNTSAVMYYRQYFQRMTRQHGLRWLRT